MLDRKITFGCIGDLHLSGKRAEVLGPCMTWAKQEALARKCYGIILAGDVFDKEAIGDAGNTPGDVADLFWNNLYDPDLHYVMVSGNHDRDGPNRGSAIKIFNTHPNFSLGLSNIVSKLLFPEYNLTLHLIPWLYGAEIEERLRTLRSTRNESNTAINILVAHCRVQGARMADQRIYNPDTDEGFCIPKDILEQFDHLVLGDLHEYQEVIPGRGGYKGILTQTSYQDEGFPCGMSFLECDSSDHQNPVKEQWVECPVARRHETLVLREQRDVDELVEVVRLDSSIRRRLRYHLDSSEASKRLQDYIIEQLPDCERDPILTVTRTKRTEERIDQLDNEESALEFWIRSQDKSVEEATRLRRGLQELKAFQTSE